MSDDQFTKLFKYMQDFRQEAAAGFKRMQSQIDDLYGLLDADLKKLETDEQERLAINNQLGRHEGWFKQLAKNTKTKLVPEP